MISHCHSEANNPYVGEAFNKTKPTKYIVYLNANNLYGWAMSQPLPIGNFEWMTDFDDWQDQPCILEVDLEYPDHLHDLQNGLPLAPERLMINGVEKLIQNLDNKEKYVVHYETLKFYLEKGLKLTDSPRYKIR